MPRPSPGQWIKRLVASAERTLWWPSRVERALREARAEAEAAHARLREALDILPQGIVFLDAEGRYILWNQQYADIYKRSADLFKPGVRLEDTLRIGVARGDYPAATGREEEWIAERLARLYNPGARHEQWLSDGRCILIEERRTTDGGVIGLRVDITEMKRREASFRLLFDANPVPMFVYGCETQGFLAVNEAALRHYGYQREQILAMTVRDIHDVGEHERLESLDRDSPDRHAGRTWTHRKADGSPIDVAIFCRALTHEGVPAMLIACIDITERKRAEAQVAYMAQHDALTGLPNRAHLRTRMEEILRRRGTSGVAVLCIDLDDFKCVNDSLGQPTGDRLLTEVAMRIRSTLEEVDAAARLGGDEFVVILADCGEPQVISARTERLLERIAGPYEVQGQQVTITAKVGIALAPGDGDSADALLKSAEMALYRAKADGSGACRFFEAEMNARVQARRQLEAEIKAALARGEFEVHYQPLVELSTGRVSGFEALLRWPHAERGFIPPSEFIPIAEETGLIVPLGDYVLDRACAAAAHWPENVKLAVNFSPIQFRLGNVVASIAAALGRSGLAAERLEVEITETLFLERSEPVLAALHSLRAQGVRISMDDFGTGYSSLSYLRSFPFDKIKIDRSFIRDLATKPEAQAIVRSILGLGSSLGVTITAEGIETEAELAYLRAHSCREGQGYLFSRARPEVEVAAMLAGPVLSVQAA